jgi:hypothetical protein
VDRRKMNKLKSILYIFLVIQLIILVINYFLLSNLNWVDPTTNTEYPNPETLPVEEILPIEKESKSVLLNNVKQYKYHIVGTVLVASIGAAIYFFFKT